VKQLKSQKLTPRQLAQQTTARDWNNNGNGDGNGNGNDDASPRLEKWQVLAVNKFDSTRKRMSVLVRSPPELGHLLMVLCKGADSAMIDPTVCEMEMEDNHTNKNNEEEEEDESMSMLQMEAHLGQFATEGLRTLVLGMRIIPEEQGRAWLVRHEAAAASISDRDAKLTQVALDIETKLHIVGVTAIEDKLQEGVPDTIANLAKAGIKLWVLTGDKRETAIEIGYATKVLTEQMTLTQIIKSDGGDNTSGDTTDASTAVQTALAKEFLRLIKQGALPEYQSKALDLDDKLQKTNGCRHLLTALYQLSHFICCCPCRLTSRIFSPCLSGGKTNSNTNTNEADDPQNDKNQNHPQLQEHGHRRLVRDRAETLVRQSVEADLKRMSPSLGLKRNASASSSNHADSPFERARCAQEGLTKMRESPLGANGEGNGYIVPSSSELRSLALAASTHIGTGTGSQQERSKMNNDNTTTDEDDLLSLASFVPGHDGTPGDLSSSFDQRKRTLLEKWFAVDRDSRDGHLGKHIKKDQRVGKTNMINKSNDDINAKDGRQHETGNGITTSTSLDPASSRALIIEGAALQYLLGDDYMSEMLFRVATQCNAVIACRVSPQQKALLVRLVRSHLQPEPITLAIGDGANDVGMIQEAHVGIGISGLEGQQAVNNSDFSIAQFRYLETLLLIHGRWNFIRLSRVVLFTFYKNAILAGLLIVYACDNLFSGTPLFDQWLVAMFNFVTQIPILLVGFFDCDIASKSYIRQHPELYGAGPDSEDMSIRKVLRWLSLCLVHIVMIYYFSRPLLNHGGTVTSAWQGTMTPKHYSRDWPGDGEGDYKTFGTAVFTVMVFAIAYKVRTLTILHMTCKRSHAWIIIVRYKYQWKLERGVRQGTRHYFSFSFSTALPHHHTSPSSAGLV
jgi:magnesium-transporting ATPase (P-type)